MRVFVGHGLPAAGMGDRPAVGGSVGRVEGRSVGLSTDRGHGQHRPEHVQETPQTQPRDQGKPTQLTLYFWCSTLVSSGTKLAFMAVSNKQC